MLKVREGPMSWAFCSVVCAEAWHDMRHEPDVKAWLREGTGSRAKVLRGEQNADPKCATKARLAYDGLCDLSRVRLSLQANSQLP